MKVPDLRFEECCNRHDLCYDNCGVSWEACNDDFRECNHRSCEVSYPLPPNVTSSSSSSSLSSSTTSLLSSNSSTTSSSTAVPSPAAPNAASDAAYWNSWLNWGCHNLADTYADAVNSFIGVWAFSASSSDRCECRCPDGAFDCGSVCMLDCDSALGSLGSVAAAGEDDGVVEIIKGGSTMPEWAKDGGE
jgi:hypothetical protein